MSLICAAAIFFIAAGILLFSTGYHIAITIVPPTEIPHAGANDEYENHKQELMYREKLAKLQEIQNAIDQDIRELQELKSRLISIASPSMTLTKPEDTLDNKGCASYSSVDSYKDNLQTQDKVFSDASKEFARFKNVLNERCQNWYQQLKWLETLPTGIPIVGDYRVSRSFGMDNNSSTGVPILHEGLDFEVSHSASVVATTDGTVTRIGKEKNYGNVIELTHAEGFMTRYARVNKIHVVTGQQVKRSQHIADVGAVGLSSTHLHYEIYQNGHVLNPVQFLPLRNN